MRLRLVAQRGLAAVELALLLPTLLVTMYFTAEVGRALYQYNTLTKAVRDGAQYLARYGMSAGVLNPTDEQEARAQNLIVYGSAGAGATALLPGLSADDVVLTYEKLYGAESNNAVTVTVTYAYQPLYGALAPAFTQGQGLLGGVSFVASLRVRGL